MIEAKVALLDSLPVSLQTFSGLASNDTTTENAKPSQRRTNVWCETDSTLKGSETLATVPRR